MHKYLTTGHFDIYFRKIIILKQNLLMWHMQIRTLEEPFFRNVQKILTHDISDSIYFIVYWVRAHVMVSMVSGSILYW